MTVTLRFKDDDTFKVDVGPRDTALCKQVPGMRAGRLDTSTGEVEWTCPAMWYHAVVCRAVFGDRLTYGADVQAWGAEQAAAERDRLKLQHWVPEPISAMMDSWPESEHSRFHASI